MDAQLDKTEKEAEYDQENWAGNKTVFRAGMLILPFYQKFTAKDEEDKKKKQIIEESRFVEIFESVSDKLTPKPKWGAMLLMHRDYQKKLLQQFGNNEFVFRPGFMILMNIKQVNEN